MAPQDYFGSCRSSISSSSYATSPSTTSFSISTPTVADSPVTPLKSLDDFAGCQSPKRSKRRALSARC